MSGRIGLSPGKPYPGRELRGRSRLYKAGFVGTLGAGSRPGIAIRRDLLCCVACLYRMPVLPVTDYLRSFRGLGRTCIVDLNAGESTAPVRMLREDRVTDFTRPHFPPCDVWELPSGNS